MKKIIKSLLSSPDKPHTRSRSNSLPAKIEIEWTISKLEKKDLSRDRFKYVTLCNLHWWPDSILEFLKILRFAYVDFINSYSSTAKIFDEPLRRFIKIFKVNSEIREVSAYLELGDTSIPDYYFNVVMNEDNCYMYELEDRKRSPNEQKHYLLTQALSKLISLDISIKEKEYENLVKVFLAIYKLKNAYAIVDDTLRNSIKAVLENELIAMNLPRFFHDFRNEFNESMVSLLKTVHDENLYTKICVFRDLLAYAYIETSTFERVFLGTKPELLSSIEIQQAEYVYRYYNKRVADQQTKLRIIQEIDDFEKIRNYVRESTEEHPSTPKYSRRYDYKGNVNLVLGTNSEIQAKTPRRTTSDMLG